MKAVIYFTEVPQQYEHKNMEHMIGEKLLATGLYKEYGLKLAFEPRATGEHGKPFLTLQPKIHYNITHSGKYVMCIIADQEIGIDVQVHKKVNYERMLERMVPADMIRELTDLREIMSQDHRSPGINIIYITVAIYIINIAFICFFNKTRCLANSSVRSYRTVYAARDPFYCTLK